jgi:hypothetical protein
MKKIAISFFALFFILTGLNLSNQEVYACSCAESNSAQKLERSDAVFLGRVMDVGGTRNREIGKVREYTFTVDKAWKGQLTKTTTIFSNDGAGASCGFKFKNNESYLVYSFKGANGELETNLCTGNLEYQKAKSELSSLGQDIEVKMNAANEWKMGNLVLYMGGILLGLGLIFLVYRQIKSRR